MAFKLRIVGISSYQKLNRFDLKHANSLKGHALKLGVGVKF